jgi:hypothetical protein
MPLRIDSGLYQQSVKEPTIGKTTAYGHRVAHMFVQSLTGMIPFLLLAGILLTVCQLDRHATSTAVRQNQLLSNMIDVSAAINSPIPDNVPTLAGVLKHADYTNSNRRINLSEACHVLLFYGIGQTDLPHFPTGYSALKALTNEKEAIRVFGASPFVRSRSGLRYLVSRDSLKISAVGESHRDLCLATFATLDLPLNTPIVVEDEQLQISDLLSESVANLNFDQREPTWTVVAFSKYLPPAKQWTTRFDEQFSFSQLVQHILNLDWVKQSCSGTHMLGALIAIDNADHRFSILDDESRYRLDGELNAKLQNLADRQQEDGSWNNDWWLPNRRITPLERRLQIDNSTYQSFLITGHLCEAISSLSPRRQIPAETKNSALAWLKEAFESQRIGTGKSWFCPTTHAARSLRIALENP